MPFVLVLILASLWCFVESTIPIIPADKIQDVIGQSTRTVIYFGRSAECQPCRVWLTALTAVLDHIDLPTYQVLSSSTVDPPLAVYIDQTPALVLFIDSTPILYEGEPSESAVRLFLERRQTAVLTLTDETFEHDTQASSGATTGDWLLAFRDGERCGGRCVSLESRLQGVAVRLAGRLSVAWLDAGQLARETAARLQLPEEQPLQLLLLRHGTVYRYHLDSYDLPSLSGFVVGLYKSSEARVVPPPPHNPLWTVSRYCLLAAVVVVAVRYMFTTRKSSADKTK